MTQTSAAVDAMWQAYCDATGTDAPLCGAFAFGDSPDMADRKEDSGLHRPFAPGRGQRDACIVDYPFEE